MTLRYRAQAMVEPRWEPIATSDDVAPTASRPVAVDVGSEEAVVWRARDGAPCAVARRCPHLDWDLVDSTVVGDELVCLGHGWSILGTGRVFKRNEFGREDDKGSTRCWPLRERHGAIEAAVDPVP